MEFHFFSALVRPSILSLFTYHPSRKSFFKILIKKFRANLAV